MKTNGIAKISFAVLAVLLLGLAGCGETPKKDDAGLSELRINGTLVELGTPASSPADAVPGASVVQTTTGVITFNATASDPSAKIVWGVVPETNPDYDGIEWGSQVSVNLTDNGNYFLVVKVTAEDGSTVQYYKAKITVQKSVGPVNAVKPVFTTQPQSAAYAFGEPIATLTAAATASDGGTVTYQWFYSDSLTEEGDIAQGETGQSYNPGVLPEGILYFYVIATNTNNAATGPIKTATQESDRAVITITTQVDAQPPVFTSHPAHAFYAGSAIAQLTAAITPVIDGGDVTYQWYEANDAVSAGNLIPGAEDPTYTPTLTSGTKYYYLVATNTNNAVTGNTSASTASNRAKITVMAFTPQRNSTAVSANNTGLFRVDLGDDFDITLYNRFTIEMTAYQQNGTTQAALAGWQDIALMQWEYAVDNKCAKVVLYPKDGGGSQLPVQDWDWRWDQLNIGPAQNANTGAAIPPYLSALTSTGAPNQTLLNSPNPSGFSDSYDPGSFSIEPLRYLYFKTAGSWAASTARFLEVTKITFYAD